MNENYISKVRQSLYGKILKKQLNFLKNEAKSKNVLQKSKKIKKETMIRRMSSSSYDNIEDKLFEQRKKPRRKIKKKKVVIDYGESPSTSEITLTLRETKNKTKKRKKQSSFSDYDESSASSTEFNLKLFFNSREQNCDESLIESHSGIEYEFLSDCMSNFKIDSCKISEDFKDNEKQFNKVQIVLEDQLSPVPSSKELMEQQPEEFEKVCEDLFVPVVNSTKPVEKINNDKRTGIEEIQQDVTISRRFSHNISNPVIERSSPAKITDRTAIQETQLDISSQRRSPTPSFPVIEISSSEKVTGDSEENLNCQHYDFGNKKLIVLKEKQSVDCYGFCSLQVVHGRLEVLGYSADKTSEEINIYSPRGTSLLVITNITDEHEVEDINLLEHILNSTNTLRNLKIDPTDVVFICSKIEDCKLTFIEKYISQQIFPKMDFKYPQIQFNPGNKLNKIKVNPEWDSVLDPIIKSTKLFITGGKGVGKSTFLRYSINRLLKKFEEVRIIDLDPGQSEFSIPGCISVLTVTKPVLGPNYTHLRKPDRSYLSNINVGHEPQKYLKCIKALMQTLDSTRDMPTLINYMGFVSNIGLNIASSVISIIRPTDVIQINSKQSKNNFASDLTPTTIENSSRFFQKDLQSVDFNLIKISSVADDKYGWALQPRQAREMCVLAYFGQIITNGIDSLLSCKVPMYEVNLDSIKITDLEGKSIPTAAVNANLVALCSNYVDEVFNVLGYGIVKGVNSTKLMLITPESTEVLEDVFYLVLGSVYLPPSVYMTSDGITGDIPYVMEGELDFLGEMTKRSYIPANKK